MVEDHRYSAGTPLYAGIGSKCGLLVAQIVNTFDLVEPPDPMLGDIASDQDRGFEGTNEARTGRSGKELRSCWLARDAKG